MKTTIKIIEEIKNNGFSELQKYNFEEYWKYFNNFYKINNQNIFIFEYYFITTTKSFKKALKEKQFVILLNDYKILAFNNFEYAKDYLNKKDDKEFNEYIKQYYIYLEKKGGKENE